MAAKKRLVKTEMKVKMAPPFAPKKQRMKLESEPTIGRTRGGRKEPSMKEYAMRRNREMKRGY